MKSINEKIALLKDRLYKIEKDIIEIISELKNTKETSNIYYAQMKTRLTQSYREINKVYNDWAKINFKTTFNFDVKEEIKRIKAYKIPINKNIDYKTVISRDGNKQRYTAIMNNSIATFQQSMQASQKRINKALYITQQTAITEKRMRQLLEESLITEKDMIQRLTASKLIRDELFKKGNKVLVIDKKGNEINYDIGKYADMVARTNLRAIQSEATIAVCNELDTDLVKVSNHNTKCEECGEYEGKVFSLTGQNKDFDILDNLPPFHPNCLHTIHPVFEEALRLTGQYNIYAKGDIE